MAQNFYDEHQEEPYVDDYDEDDIKHGILEAALELVSTHGWTKSAIVAAAESYGYPGVAHGKSRNFGQFLFWYASLGNVWSVSRQHGLSVIVSCCNMFVMFAVPGGAAYACLFSMNFPRWFPLFQNVSFYFSSL